MEPICAEAAEQEFNRFTEIWDVASDVAEMTEEDLESFEPIKKRIIKGITEGKVQIGEKGEFSYTLRKPIGDTEHLELKIERANIAIMDNYKERQKIHMLHAYIASLAGLPPKMIAAVDARDLKMIQGVALLFLGS